MDDRLSALVLALARELREAIHSGEHPATALAACCRCTAYSCRPDLLPAYERLTAVRGTLERCADLYGVAPVRCGLLLRGALEALAGLAAEAELVRAEVEGVGA